MINGLDGANCVYSTQSNTHTDTQPKCAVHHSFLAKSIRAGKATIEGNSGGPALYVTDYDHKLKKDIQH